MRKKERFPLAKIADDLDKPLYGMAFLSMAVMIASLLLAAVCGDPAILRFGVWFGLVGTAVAGIIVFVACLLCEMETGQLPYGKQTED